MGRRFELQRLLIDLLESNNVYFQQPDTDKIQYPCIIYTLDSRYVNHANNVPYTHRKRYQIKVIDQDPDSCIPDKIAQLPLCSFERAYPADGLNHQVFNLYF